MLKLFIVDNSELIVDRLVKVLSEIEEIKIIGIANNAKIAPEYIFKSNPDIVILDIHMPDGNGIDILKKIKQESKKTKVIMLTNYPENDYRKICTEIGAEYFFDKSIEFENVVDVCRELSEKEKRKIKV